MKRLKILCLCALTAISLTSAAYAADPFSIKTALDSTANIKECAISMTGQTILEFSARDLELRMELGEGSLQGITVTSPPLTQQGVLYLDGVEVEPYQFLSRGEIDELCFVPNETAAFASMTLLPQGHNSVSTRLSISVLNYPKPAPTAESVHYSTLKNTALSGFIPATSPDGDAITIKVIRAPDKGVVDISGQAFVYQPYYNLTGTDSFTVCAVDRFSNYSEEAVIEISIENNRSGFAFTDMSGNPSEYAAIKLHENNVIGGEQLGANWFFYPNRQVTRGEFLVMLLAAANMDKNLPPTVNTRLENDADIPMWLKPYVKKAVDEGILPDNLPFGLNEVPTRAEAVVLVDRAAKITDVKDFQLQIFDAVSIPEWALPSYKDLAAYRMLDLYDGYAHPSSALTKSCAADLIWQLWKHCNR